MKQASQNSCPENIFFWFCRGYMHKQLSRERIKRVICFPSIELRRKERINKRNKAPLARMKKESRSSVPVKWS